MPRFSRMQVLNAILDVQLIPLFYHADVEIAMKVVQACADGGARVVEFTNRGDRAYQVFSRVCEQFSKVKPDLILGAGTITDPATAALFIANGASFIVAPNLDVEVARTCNRHKVAYLPGCGTATEIHQAEELGVEIIKIFPADTLGGPAFVKAILGPSPWSRLMPSGGVKASRESIHAWLDAGVAVVGMGSELIRKEWVSTGNYSAITDLVGQVIGWIREWQQKTGG
jgi:2-dehydro-3-deoxyphosphogluconate aldolase/(4S)-4-hydroxy-2-oxoglutarate aldolase